MSAPVRWDLFCRVVDNFGDIGIGWRLARQLVDGATEVRLFVDDLASFAHIEPRVDPTSSHQVVAGIIVVRWPAQGAGYDTPDVVVELLGCGLPSAVMEAMAEVQAKPVWIDFEHLSAEAWVDEFHAMPSPHPSLPLVKHFFFPGFGERTGGLLVEPDVGARRQAFVDDEDAVGAFRRRLGIPCDGRRVLSLFAYPHAPVGGLLEALARDGAWTVVAPEGVLADALDAWRLRAMREPALVTIPFVDQDDYDRLLWICDVNCVRGEDSFVRAQLAGRPFAWHIYPQADDAHRRKLAAFEDVHASAFADLSVELVDRDFQEAWNDPVADTFEPACRWLAARPALAEAADRWRSKRMAAMPLVDRLRAFVGAHRSD